jgi:hypothetical protein
MRPVRCFSEDYQMSKEAMKLALEALEHLQPTALTSFYTIGDRDKAITALRQALEKPAEKFDPNDSFERDEAARAIVREFMRNH